MLQSAKVLPCGHIYHLGCLRDWLQQSGTDNFTCPICRTPLFVKKQTQPGETQLPHHLLPWSIEGCGEVVGARSACFFVECSHTVLAAFTSTKVVVPLATAFKRTLRIYKLE